MRRHLRHYRRRARRIRRSASHHRVEATVLGRMAVVGALDRLCDIADMAGDADAVASLDRCIGELCCVARPADSRKADGR
jgi:hypothetical protein